LREGDTSAQWFSGRLALITVASLQGGPNSSSAESRRPALITQHRAGWTGLSGVPPVLLGCRAAIFLRELAWRCRNAMNASSSTFRGAALFWDAYKVHGQRCAMPRLPHAVPATRTSYAAHPRCTRSTSVHATHNSCDAQQQEGVTSAKSSDTASWLPQNSSNLALVT
jgi:hypothetical protein